MFQIINQRMLSSADDEYGYHLILFITLELLIAQIIKHFSNVTNIPYTPMLTVFGIVIGVISKYLGSWGSGIDFASNINPHLFFMIFLPPLIFESSFSMDPHILKTEFWKVLILAGPMLVVHSFIVAVIIKWVLGYDQEFSFAASVMFGGLISATDPVAVVSLLKSVGASRTLTILIEGESLVNDGTAAVMFLCALDLVKGAEFSAGEIIGTFWRLSFGGPAIGIVFGIVSLMWLRRIVDNPVLETNLTIMTAYLVFYTSEFTILKVSGILSLVHINIQYTNKIK